MNSSYSNLPAGASTSDVHPFQINIPDEEVNRMLTLVKLSNVASASYENSLPDGSRDLGIRREWLLQAKETWETKFNWREHEDHLNSFPHFKTKVPAGGSETKTINLHFAALFSRNPEAVPVLLLHGWPGSFIEFLPMLSLLKTKYPDPSHLPYHLIVPSLPGYALSDPFPKDKAYGLEDVARILDHLMVKILNLPGYIPQAGDVGSRVARILCAQYPSCPAVLLNFSPIPSPPDFDESTLNAAEKRGLERGDWFKTYASAYALEQGTRPATLGFALSSNPLALLAWIGEKYLDWTDHSSFPDQQKLIDEAILSVSLYWLTGHAHTCFYSYRETYTPKDGPPKSHASPQYHIKAPKKLGYSNFPYELVPVPRAWIETSGNLVFWRDHDKGGHFAALEQPETLLKDLEDFIKEVTG